jgi:hypothetical protein
MKKLGLPSRQTLALHPSKTKGREKEKKKGKEEEKGL